MLQQQQPQEKQRSSHSYSSSGSSLQQEQGSRKAMFDTVFLRFQTTRYGLFGLHFVAVPSFTATAFPCPGGLPLQH
jgi:hypothetical protein